jgi:uncharacterized protein (TIGR00730 family)
MSAPHDQAPAWRRVGVFCGSSHGSDPADARVARELGTELARRGLGLVYGGGNVGLMGEVANAALEAGAEVIGVIPEALAEKEIAHWELTELRIVPDMHRRKAAMYDLSDAFIALPGGIGTLEEFFEVLTWAQLGMHAKPCGLLDATGYWPPLLAMLDRAVARGFYKPEHRRMVLVEDTVEALLEAMADYRAPVLRKWIDRDDA